MELRNHEASLKEANFHLKSGWVWRNIWGMVEFSDKKHLQGEHRACSNTADAASLCASHFWKWDRGTWFKKRLPSRCLLSRDKLLIPASCQEIRFMGHCLSPVTGQPHLLLLVWQARAPQREGDWSMTWPCLLCHMCPPFGLHHLAANLTSWLMITFFPPGLQWSLAGDFLTLSIAQGVSRPKSILVLSSENKTRQSLPLPSPRLSEGHGSPAEFNFPLSTTPATAQQDLVCKSLTQQAGESPVPRLKGI